MTRAPKVIVIDFETHAIQGRPHYPPTPVGVSIQWPNEPPYYYAWAHINGENNCPEHHADKLLHDVFESNLPVLMHSSKFDVDVAEAFFDIQRYKWNKYHDTLPLLFLDNPRGRNFQLKPAAELYLNQPPEERDVVKDWLLENQPVEGVRITKTNFMAYIAYCPPEIVGPYANGDCQRTLDLFNLLYPLIVERGMQEAYDRERRLMPVLLDIERNGTQVDHQGLSQDVERYTSCKARLDAWLRKKMKVGEDVNIDSGPQLAAALVNAKLADPELMGVTSTGKLQTTQDAYERSITDMQVRNSLIYRSQLNTCLHTFMEPWLATADASGGLIYTTWNSVRTPQGQKSVGTRTGRLCIAKGTRIQQPGKETPIEQLQQGDLVYCFDDTLQPQLRKILWTGYTGYKKVVRVHWLGTGHHTRGYLDCTPDHLLRLWDGTYKRADQLQLYDRILAIHRNIKQYNIMSISHYGEERENRLVWRLIHGYEGDEVHHIDENKHNDDPMNLENLSSYDHKSMHSKKMWEEGRGRAVYGEKHYMYIHLTPEDIINALQLTAWQIMKTAELLQVDYGTLVHRMKMYDISIPALFWNKNGNIITDELVREGRYIHHIQGQNAALQFIGVNYYKWQDIQIYFGYTPYKAPKGRVINHSIVKIECLPSPCEVYDIEVEGNET